MYTTTTLVAMSSLRTAMMNLVKTAGECDMPYMCVCMDVWICVLVGT